jgi:hypothetical protein
VNAFAILDVEAPDRQYLKMLVYLDIPSFRTGSRMGCIGVQIVMFLIGQPLGVTQK